MTQGSRSTSSTSQEPPAVAASVPAPPVDLDALTEKVYRLLLEDLRMERARLSLPSVHTRDV